MQKLTPDIAESRLKEMVTHWDAMRAADDHRIHVEFGHFSSLDHFGLFEKYAVRNADSLGMNEVELDLVLQYWDGKVTDINKEIDSTPNLE